MADKLIFPTYCQAIDDSSTKGAEEKIEMISGVPGDYGIKFNLDLLFKDRAIIGRTVKKTGKPVFADLKAWNGKRTLGELLKTLAGEGASIVNFYVLADNLLERAIEESKKHGLIVLGVTMLTHHTDAYCARFFKYPTVKQMVRLLAGTALERECDGYILPGTTLAVVNNLPGIKFTPGTRPAWFENKGTNDQEQIADPIECLEGGANIVSCGSPVFKSSDPPAALTRIITDIEKFQAKR